MALLWLPLLLGAAPLALATCADNCARAFKGDRATGVAPFCSSLLQTTVLAPSGFPCYATACTSGDYVARVSSACSCILATATSPTVTASSCPSQSTETVTVTATATEAASTITSVSVELSVTTTVTISTEISTATEVSTVTSVSISTEISTVATTCPAAPTSTVYPSNTCGRFVNGDFESGPDSAGAYYSDPMMPWIPFLNQQGGAGSADVRNAPGRGRGGSTAAQVYCSAYDFMPPVAPESVSTGIEQWAHLCWNQPGFSYQVTGYFQSSVPGAVALAIDVAGCQRIGPCASTTYVATITEAEDGWSYFEIPAWTPKYLDYYALVTIRSAPVSGTPTPDEYTLYFDDIVLTAIKSNGVPA